MECSYLPEARPPEVIRAGPGYFCSLERWEYEVFDYGKKHLADMREVLKCRPHIASAKKLSYPFNGFRNSLYCRFGFPRALTVCNPNPRPIWSI